MSDQAKAEEAVQQHLALLEAELGRPMVLEEQQVATCAYPLGLAAALAAGQRCQKRIFHCGKPTRNELHIRCCGTGYDLTDLPQFVALIGPLIVAYRREFKAEYNESTQWEK